MLWREGEVVGYLATIVEPFWGPAKLFRPQQVWLLLTWADGQRERIFEDYPPWTAVEELRKGVFHWDGERAGDYVATWAEGTERDRLWSEVGIKAPVGAYL